MESNKVSACTSSLVLQVKLLWVLNPVLRLQGKKGFTWAEMLSTWLQNQLGRRWLRARFALVINQCWIGAFQYEKDKWMDPEVGISEIPLLLNVLLSYRELGFAVFGPVVLKELWLCFILRASRGRQAAGGGEGEGALLSSHPGLCSTVQDWSFYHSPHTGISTPLQVPWSHRWSRVLCCWNCYWHIGKSLPQLALLEEKCFRDQPRKSKNHLFHFNAWSETLFN